MLKLLIDPQIYWRIIGLFFTAIVIIVLYAASINATSMKAIAAFQSGEYNLGYHLMFDPMDQWSPTTKTAYAKMGEKNSIKLPNASLKTLNSDSQVQFNKKFNISNRTIDLEGEAYFDIKKGDSPFIINTDYATVTVLGTSFNLKSREDGFELGVNSGVVSVSNGIKNITLLKGQLINLKSDLDDDLTPQKSYSNYPDWINNKFYCEKTPLIELYSEIERRFNIKVKFYEPEIKKIAVTGIIDAPNLNTVLRTISLLTHHEFKLDGDLCTIF